MKYLPVLIFATVLALTACGGGDGDVQSKSFPNAASYVGTWVESCSNDNFQPPRVSSQTTLQISTVGNQLSVNSSSNYYLQPNCSGSPIATAFFNVAVTASYMSTQNVSLVIPPASAPVLVAVDQVSIARPAGFYTVTGAAVYDKVTNSVNKRCFDKSPTYAVCLHDTSLQPPIAETAGFYLTGGTLYGLQFANGVYSVGGTLTKK